MITGNVTAVGAAPIPVGGDWDEPLAPDHQARILDETARFVVRRGLQTPAIIALEMHKPLGNIAGHGLVFFAPLLGPLLGLNRMQTLARLLMEPEAIEQLIRRIETETDNPTPTPTTTETGEMTDTTRDKAAPTANSKEPTA